MTNSFDSETNQVEDEYNGEEEDDLDDFIVYSDEDEALKTKKKLRQQQEEEDQQEGDEDEEELVDEEEEAPVGVQEILSLREQLKEKIRRKNAAIAAGVGQGGSSSVNQQTAAPAKHRFGTFFGPSRQSLAPRVIQEGCSSIIKEIQNARPRNGASLVSDGQPGASRSLQKPKIVSEGKRKADALRENRDYSSLFSDDSEASPSTNERTGNRPPLVPKPDVQVRGPVSSAGKNRAPNGQTAKLLSNGHGLKGAVPSSQGRVQNKAGSPGKFSVANGKGTVAAARNGSISAATKKTTVLQPSSNGQKLQPPLQSKRPQTLLPGQRQQQSSQGQRLQPASQSRRLQGNGHYQIQEHASSARGQRSGQNGSAEPLNVRAKPAQKQLAPSSKLKASGPVEKGATKRKAHEAVDYASLVSKEIGAIFGYDRSKYDGIDEDDSNMEADYASILKEERRSAKLARQEDEEQLRLIQEEERRERAKKKRKASTNAI